MKHRLYFVLQLKTSDCSASGLTSRVDSGHLFWDCTRDEAIDYCREKNIVPEDQFFLVEKEIWGEKYAYAEPLIKPDRSMCQVFGGNYITTSDSAGYNQGYCRTAFPIPVHDRFETWEEYQVLST